MNNHLCTFETAASLKFLKKIQFRQTSNPHERLVAIHLAARPKDLVNVP